ncbi:MAG: PDZ domain-containing protein [Chloroflexi bacterium]|nr:MAG: PDZ domain-containing protein [Chloroflexota bacterium]MBL1192916.1 PDZ domain-containing protein [Chloroflexota bacterium]NOH10209.1 hypothetical protein [Chloroflexota bacterium]
MAAKTQTLRFERSIAAPINQVYQAFTNSVSLREWLSDSAEFQAKQDGVVCLYWYDGRFVVGRYTKLEKDKLVRMNWQSSFGPQSEQMVQVDFKKNGDQTALTLAHSGLEAGENGQEDIASIKKDWESSLDNLKSVLETGIDQRLFKRPMIGILIDRLINAEIASKEGLPVDHGLELSGVIDGMGAAELSMGDGTIITSLNDIKITNYQDISEAIGNKQAGDVVSATYYMNGQEHQGELKLSARPQAEVPATPQGLAESATQIYGKINDKLDELFQGASAQAAELKPAVDEWSAREVVAHLIAHEQHLAYWGAALERAKGRVSYSANSHQLVAAIANAYPNMAALREGLEQAQKQNVAFLAGLPVEFVARKGSYHRLAQNFLEENKHHAKGHFDQIVAALENAKESIAG